jgi:hypothetical protein
LALEVIESVRATLPDVALKIVDVSLAPEVAVKYGVTATPAIAINGQLAFRGIPRENALRARLRAAAGVVPGSERDRAEPGGRKGVSHRGAQEG